MTQQWIPQYAHRQVDTSAPGIHVDELILPLIEALWAAGFKTGGCCQDWECTGRADIVFKTLDEGYRFVRDSISSLAAELDFQTRSEHWSLSPNMWPASECVRGVVQFPAHLLPRLVEVWT